jgi:drug/metabolite transporter (DMT)-like permease
MTTGAVARWVALPVGVLSLSVSSTLIRLTTAPPLLTATNRLLWAAAILLGVAFLTNRHEVRAIDLRTLRLLFASGGLLGLHFALWTNALFWTSVASAVLLVDTHPVWVAIAARIFLSEPTPLGVWAGIAVTLIGSTVVAMGDFEFGGRALVGDAMAATSAVTFAGYLVIGRRARQALSLPLYAGTVYAIAGVLLLAVTVASGISLAAFSQRDLVLWGALVLVPTLGGHTVLNWTLRHIPVSLVGVSILAEPIFASALAWLVLGEPPPATALAGGLLILAGLYLAHRSA